MSYNESLHPREASGQWTQKTGAAPSVSLTPDRTVISADAIQNAWGKFSAYAVEPEAGGHMRIRFENEDGEVAWEAVTDTNGLLTDVYHKGKRVNSYSTAYEDAEQELLDAHSIPLSADELSARRELNDAIAYERSTGLETDAELHTFFGAKDYQAVDNIRLRRVKEVGEEYRSTLQHPLRGLAEGRKRDQMNLIDLASRKRTAELRAAGHTVPASRLGYNNPFRDAANDVELEAGIRNYDGNPADALEYATERKRELHA